MTDATEPTPRRRTVGYTTWQVRRVLGVLAWFTHHPDGTVMAAAERFGVSVPQLRHELTQVSTCGIPPYLPGSLLEVSTSGMHAEVTCDLGLGRAPMLTEAEAGALLLSLERLASVLSADDRSDLGVLTDRLRTLARDYRDRRENFTPDEYTTPTARGTAGPADTSASSGPLATNLPPLRQALADRRVLRLTYRSLSSDRVSRRELVPDQLEFIGGEGYLWARRRDGDAEPGEPGEQRCFNVSRMSGIEVTDVPAPPAVERAVDADDPFGFDRDGQHWAEIELEDDAAWMFEYLPMWQTETDAESAPLRAQIPDTGDWLERFLLGHAPQIRGVVDNDDLSGRVARRAAAALEAYRTLA